MSTLGKSCVTQWTNIFQTTNALLQNHAWIKDLFKVQDRTMDFHVTEYRRGIDTDSDSTWQLFSGKQWLGEFWYRITEEYPQLSEKATKIFFPFLIICLYKAKFSLLIQPEQYILTV